MSGRPYSIESSPLVPAYLSVPVGMGTSGRYDLDVPVIEVADLVRAAVHGSERLVPTRIDPDGAEIRRRTTLPMRADLIHVTFVARDGGSRLEAITSHNPMDVQASSRTDLIAFFELIRAELERREADG